MVKKILKFIGIAFLAILVLGAIIDGLSEETAIKQDNEVKSTPTATPSSTVTKTNLDNEEKQVHSINDDSSELTAEQKEKIVAYFKSENEPQIQDATFTSDTTLALGMLDDGSKRDGIADYACQVLINDFDVKEKIYIKIIDIAKLVQTDKWVKIGDTHCNS